MAISPSSASMMYGSSSISVFHETNLRSKGPMKLQCWLVFGLVSICSLNVFAQPAPDAVDQYVRTEMEKHQIPGLALLVSRDGKPVRAQGYGFSNLELQVPVKPETVFQSGSVGKQFTATAVMMLVEEGRIGLEDPLTKYFPDAPATWKRVTIRQLLSHTAGFTDYPKNFNMLKDYTDPQLLK